MADLKQEARAVLAELDDSNTISRHKNEEAARVIRALLASRPASPAAPWGEGGCFGHCDPEGWTRCRKPASPATREAVATVVAKARYSLGNGIESNETIADALLAAFTIAEKGDDRG